jgi:hypothetical protein
MYNFIDKTCTNHEKPKKLKSYISPSGTITLHCSECVNIIELGFKENADKINTKS